MTIASELAELGHLGGPATMKMLKDRWWSATSQVNALRPQGGWDGDNRQDLLHEFLRERLADLTDQLVTIGADEEALRKMTSRIMKNWLIDQARKTDMGAIRVRLEALLKGSPKFARTTAQRWTLADTPDLGSRRGDEASLLVAAWAVRDVRPVRWSDTNRRAPMANGLDLTRVMAAVLGCAGPDGVEIGLLARVFRRRFGVVLVSHVPLEADDTLAGRLLAPSEVDTREMSAAFVRAAEVYTQLSDRERRILLCLDDHHRVMEILQVRRTVAYNHIKRIRAVLAALAGEDLDFDAVVAELVRLARADAAPDDNQGQTSEPSMTTTPTGAQR